MMCYPVRRFWLILLLVSLGLTGVVVAQNEGFWKSGNPLKFKVYGNATYTAEYLRVTIPFRAHNDLCDVRASGYGGILAYAPSIPSLHFKFKVWDEELKKLQFTALLTVASLWHELPDKIDRLILQLLARRTSETSYSITVRVLHFQVSTRPYNITVIQDENATVYAETNSFVKVDFYPNFYNASNELVFGYWLWVKGETLDYIHIAWDKVPLTNNTQEVYKNVEEKLKALYGWYVWLGLGLEWYEPYDSPVQTLNLCLLPSVDEIVYSSEYRDVYAENWNVDAFLLADYFVSGRLKEYYGVTTSEQTTDTHSLISMFIIFSVGLILGWTTTKITKRSEHGTVMALITMLFISALLFPNFALIMAIMIGLAGLMLHSIRGEKA